MAGTVYISEAEAARDFAAVVDRTLKGEQIVVRRDGCDVILLSPMPAAPERSTKSLGEVIDGLRRSEAEQGLATVDDEFAKDMDEIVAGRRLDARPAARTVDQARALLARRSQERRTAGDDAEFAADMEAVRAIYNAPLDDSKWA